MNPMIPSDPFDMEYFEPEAGVIRFLDEGLIWALPSEDGKVIELFVNVNDMYYWATADSEFIRADELKDLAELYNEYGPWAATIWVTRKRKMRPQIPVMKEMKKAGAWIQELEDLPERESNFFNPDFDKPETLKL